MLPSNNLKFVCLNICWAVNHVKIDRHKNWIYFLMEVTLVCTPKIVNVCKALFTGPHQNLEYLFIGYNFRKNWKMANKFWYVFEIHRFPLHMKKLLLYHM